MQSSPELWGGRGRAEGRAKITAYGVSSWGIHLFTNASEENYKESKSYGENSQLLGRVRSSVLFAELPG